MKLMVSALTDIGKKRLNNEDNFCVNGFYNPVLTDSRYATGDQLSEGVFCVCDGMGGEEFGEFASLAGVALTAYYYEDILLAEKKARDALVLACIQKANSIICNEMQKKKARIGSTIAVLCVKENVADFYNVGDSRIYFFRDGILEMISKEHTAAQMKVDMGVITAKEAEHDSAKHRLTQNLGIFESEMIIEPSQGTKQVQSGDVFLLCSDGLTDMVPENEICSILESSNSAEQKTNELVARALENGGRDNVTAIVVVIM